MNVEAAYFADSLYNAWQMEHKDCRNGILLAISVEDREVSQSSSEARTSWSPALQGFCGQRRFSRANLGTPCGRLI